MTPSYLHYAAARQPLTHPVQIPWRASSPDLNYIETIWNLLKTAKIVNPRPTKQVAREEWALISEQDISRAIYSLPERVQACIQAGGGHTRRTILNITKC